MENYSEEQREITLFYQSARQHLFLSSSRVAPFVWAEEEKKNYFSIEQFSNIEPGIFSFQ